jgi:hypothetical protein
VRLALDVRRHTARLARTYPHPGSPLLSDSQGNMQTLPGNRVLIGWGSIPSVTELSQDGGLLFDAHLPAGMSSYRAFRFAWTGRPTSPPAVSATVLASGDSTAVSASWNGASDVASWRVLAGPSPGALAARAAMPDSGFESTVTFPDTYPEDKAEFVAVQALGAAGELLGTSATVSVGHPPSPKGG